MNAIDVFAVVDEDGDLLVIAPPGGGQFLPAIAKTHAIALQMYEAMRTAVPNQSLRLVRYAYAEDITPANGAEWKQ